jgi:hypothetical protein
MALHMSIDKSSMYILFDRGRPVTLGRIAVAMSTGLSPYGETPSQKVACVVATR